MCVFSTDAFERGQERRPSRDQAFGKLLFPIDSDTDGRWAAMRPSAKPLVSFTFVPVLED